ncbi:hypothetical protein CAOG_08493 [Capsaspora owczarzaki ATCC 30864]|uniref:Protein transport protein SEC23 n=1 Tax=Capsaspora owczarzaki (strain ATCC 30864) TaxID=595528 RepID=A0A0D2VIM4_CAPO3|nr:hypothetical protein CAOG_08493 [Capsaspora owczarzaki ATCC 30864]KJE89842.1 hypothetical protein CAOG_008493 [Capsaspora owczarzaki ATCC 30864]|eukprot:XP_011270075.1 hypothetical protein CAOG_08493 [Capsaspora owczarzaki ATCC 30864]
MSVHSAGVTPAMAAVALNTSSVRACTRMVPKTVALAQASGLPFGLHLSTMSGQEMRLVDEELLAYKPDPAAVLRSGRQDDATVQALSPQNASAAGVAGPGASRGGSTVLGLPVAESFVGLTFVVPDSRENTATPVLIPASRRDASVGEALASAAPHGQAEAEPSRRGGAHLLSPQSQSGNVAQQQQQPSQTLQQPRVSSPISGMTSFVTQRNSLLIPSKAPVVHLPPDSCNACRGYFNRHCVSLSSGDWKCCLCPHINPPLRRAVRPEELMHDTIEYNVAQDTPLAMAHPEPVIVLLFDENIPQSHVKETIIALKNTLDDMPRSAKVAVVTFSTLVSVYRLTATASSSSDVFPGSTLLSLDDAAQLSESLDSYIVPLHANLLAVMRAVYLSNRSTGPTSSPAAAKCCLGSALAVAETLLKQWTRRSNTPQLPRGSQIIVFASGHPSYGPGAVVEEHEMMDVLVNIVCIGFAYFCIPVLRSAIQPSGGTLVMHNEVRQEMAADLRFLLLQPYGRDGRVSYKCSTNSIELTHVIGPASPLRDTDKMGADDLCFLATVRPHQSLGVLFEVVRDITDENVFFQFTSQYTNPMGDLVHRVTTLRYSTTTDRAALLDSADTDACVAFIAKQAILASRDGATPAQIVSQLDYQLGFVLKAHSDFDRFNHQTKLVLPTAIEDLPSRMYHLRRSPMLATQMQPADDIEYLRSIFLQSDVVTCRKMIEPLMFEVSDCGTFTPLSLSTLSLWPDRTILVDYETHIHVWLGLAVVNKLQAEAIHAGATKLDMASHAPMTWCHKYVRRASMTWCHKYVRRASSLRFPHPQFIAMLTPAHNDTIALNLIDAPDLARLSVEQLQSHLERFPKSDEWSLRNYLRFIQTLDMKHRPAPL